MIRSEDFTPEIYKNSRDYKALLTILDVVSNISKYEIDTLSDLYDPMKCDERVLPYLAEMIGYHYNIKDSVQENRVIINNFSKLLHYKGSELGIKLAAALSLNSVGNSDEIADLKFLEVIYDRKHGLIYIVYPKTNTKVRNLIDYVRPVGMAAMLYAAAEQTNRDKIAITTDVEYIVRKYQTGKDSIDYAVELSEVSLGSLREFSTGGGGGGGSVDGNTWNDLLSDSSGQGVTWNKLLEDNITWNSFLTT